MLYYIKSHLQWLAPDLVQERIKWVHGSVLGHFCGVEVRSAASVLGRVVKSPPSWIWQMFSRSSLTALFWRVKLLDTGEIVHFRGFAQWWQSTPSVPKHFSLLSSNSNSNSSKNCDKVSNFTVRWCLPSDNNSSGGAKPIKMQKQVEKTLFVTQQTPTVEYSPGVTQARRSIVPLWRRGGCFDWGISTDSSYRPAPPEGGGFTVSGGKWQAEPGLILLKDARSDSSFASPPLSLLSSPFVSFTPPHCSVTVTARVHAVQIHSLLD